ncbi:FprA family A-type flavoprotein [Desulfurococcaceae archaeon MEX13E-LK6-19]|nr:FprA family A-type flavoprotein [Desulfurococcaceae archaeon MEX13E-LK6-19]
MAKTHVVNIAQNIYLLRIDDDRVRYFEALWEIPEGITYNAYFIDTGEKKILIDTWKHVYSREFIEVLRGIVDLKDIDYIIVNHMEPDHSGSLPIVLEENNYRATVLGHPMALSMINSFYGVKPKTRPVKDGETLAIGDATLTFVYTPWLHWPETIMTYYHNEHILFSGDAFGSFGIPGKIFDEEDEAAKITPFVRKYFTTIIGFYRGWVVKAIDKLAGQNLKIDMIAPAHGLVWKHNPMFIVDYYRRLALMEPVGRKVVVIYSSMYGFIDKAVGKCVEELKRNGVEVVVFKFTDTVHDRLSDLLSEINDASGLVVATATYEAGVFPLIKYIVELIARKVKARKPALVLAAYGWGGVAGKKIGEMLGKAGYDVVGVVEFKSGLTGDTEKLIVQHVKTLVEKISG